MDFLVYITNTDHMVYLRKHQKLLVSAVVYCLVSIAEFLLQSNVWCALN